VYDGDRMETQDNGSSEGLRSGQIQLHSRNPATLWMNHENSLVAPTLQARARWTFRAGKTEQEFEIKGRRRPACGRIPLALTIGQSDPPGLRYFWLPRARKISKVTAGKETKVIGRRKKTYRVVRKGACGAMANHAPLAVGQSRFFLFLPCQRSRQS